MDRVPIAHEIVDRLTTDPSVIDAVVRDGWPRAMVEVGFQLHAKTWNVSETVAGLEAELRNYDGPKTTDRRIAHLWPALPGAGVAPLLHGYLLGVTEQWVKPSRDGEHFARRFVEIWREFDESVDLCGPNWSDADHIIVSGSDETVTAVIDRVGAHRTVGYGHRVSAAIIDGTTAEHHLYGLARDVVLWHQLGCFSARAVFLVGGDPPAFADALAAAIAAAERDLDATVLSEGELATRAQHLGSAEFETDIWRAEIGWVERRARWGGESSAPHAVTLVAVPDADSTVDAFEVAPDHVQGIAVGASRATGEKLEEIAATLGATRVCRPGDLQQPEPDWPHDGMSNVAALVGPGVGRVGDNPDASQGDVG